MRRGYNIESIAVGTTEDPNISRMTIVVDGDKREVEQITKNVHKLIEVIKVTDLTDEKMVDREPALIKVSADASNRSEILQIVDIFRAKIVDVSDRSVIVEVTGDEGKVDAMVGMLRSQRMLVRTGKIAMARGARPELPSTGASASA